MIDKIPHDGTGYVEEDIWQAFDRILESFKQGQFIEEYERDFEEWGNYWGE